MVEGIPFSFVILKLEISLLILLSTACFADLENSLLVSLMLSVILQQTSLCLSKILRKIFERKNYLNKPRGD